MMFDRFYRGDVNLFIYFVHSGPGRIGEESGKKEAKYKIQRKKNVIAIVSCECFDSGKPVSFSGWVSSVSAVDEKIGQCNTTTSLG